MSRNPKISVIIPTYNRADLLPRAIKSVLSQTFQDFELIIVDDGSTDNTKEVVEEFQKRDRRIKYIWQEKNSGAPAKPTNIGIMNSTGEFIAILEHDDEWLPQKLEKQIAIFNDSKNNMLGLVGCDVLVVSNKTRYFRVPKVKKGKTFEKFLKSTFICSASSALIRRSVFQDVGLFDENLFSVQDWEMWTKMAYAGYAFKFIREPLLRYYIHGQNITATTSIEKKEKDLDYIFNKYRKYYENNSKLYSTKLRYDGTRYVLANELKKGRKKFLQSIKIYPFNFKAYLYLFLSFFGSKFYYQFSQIKSKIKNVF